MVSTVAILALLIGAVSVALATAHATPSAADTPIKHVVVFMQENHSFDNVLGKLCIDDNRCDGSLVGKGHKGQTIPLRQSTNFVPNVVHSVNAERASINKGAMNGFDTITGCTSGTNYGCYTYYDPSQIPNLAYLARHYALSDRAFTASEAPSWGGHLAVVMPGNGWRNGWNVNYMWDGFNGNLPVHKKGAPPVYQGWGCDSNLDSSWKATPSAAPVLMPSCIPDADGGGAYRTTKVKHVPTILDSLDDAGLSWNIYGTTDPTDNGYQWNICPSFAECREHQQQHVVDDTTFATDAAAGNLPSVSIVIPMQANSQHNKDLMTQGDNWLGKQIAAVMNGPDWDSTAIFITYDDCGCFYDHVNPNTPTTGWGIRVPMVIVSPYAKAGFTDSTPTSSTGGILAFIEHTFGLPALGEETNLYDFSDSFDFGSPETTTTDTETTTSEPDTTTATTDTTTSTVPDTSPDTTDTTDSTTTTTDPNATFPFDTPTPTLAPNQASDDDPT